MKETFMGGGRRTWTDANSNFPSWRTLTVKVDTKGAIVPINCNAWLGLLPPLFVTSCCPRDMIARDWACALRLLADWVGLVH